MLPAGFLMWTLWLIFMGFFVVVSILWGLKTGQFKDNEEAKFRMMIDRPLEPWPGREQPKEKKKAPEPDQEGGVDERKRT